MKRATRQPPLAGWDDLARELDAWQATGREATLWWRDDDAGPALEALDRLLDVAADAGVPIALAVIPAEANDALAARLAGAGDTHVMQHGWAHRDHAAPGAKKCELAPGRPLTLLLEELARGRDRLAALAGPAPVLVPPWNRIRADILEALPALGLTGLSRYGPRAARHASPGLSQTNTHVDIIDWRAGRRFRGVAPVLGALVSHLAARRARTVDATEPTGLLSHHRVHDEQCWSFLPELLRRTRAHPAVRWMDPRRAVLG